MMNKVYLSEAMLSEVFWPRLRNAPKALPEATEITETILSVWRIVHKHFPQKRQDQKTKVRFKNYGYLPGTFGQE